MKPSTKITLQLNKWTITKMSSESNLNKGPGISKTFNNGKSVCDTF